MTELLIEGAKLFGAAILLLLAAGLLWAVVVGLFRSVTGQAKAQSDRESRAWIAGWNAAQRGAAADADEWARRMGEELDR